MIAAIPAGKPASSCPIPQTSEAVAIPLVAGWLTTMPGTGWIGLS
jgi:hypothetical protein